MSSNVISHYNPNLVGLSQFKFGIKSKNTFLSKYLTKQLVETIFRLPHQKNKNSNKLKQ